MNIEYELLNRKGQKLMMICSKIDKKLMIYLAILLMFYVFVPVNCNTYFVFISLRKWNPLLLLLLRLEIHKEEKHRNEK